MNHSYRILRYHLLLQKIQLLEYLSDRHALNPNNQIPSTKQIPITKYPNNPNFHFLLCLEFRSLEFGYYLMIGAWYLVLITPPTKQLQFMISLLHATLAPHTGFTAPFEGEGRR
jgi:hypothetical protein